MPVSVVSIYYIERRNDESRLLPDLSYIMVKVYFEFSRQMTYLVSTLFNNKFVVVVVAVVVVEVAVVLVLVFVIVATFVAKSLEKWETSVVNWKFFLLDHVNGVFNVNSVFALHRLLLL